MRLTLSQAQQITEIIHHHVGNSARIWLFGSRLDDQRRGGDLDLYVEAEPQSIMNELRCKLSLEECLDLPVDLIVRRPGDSSPIAQIAKTAGLPL